MLRGEAPDWAPSGDGYGSGYGSGDGDGSGSGYGSGSGSGSGSGYQLFADSYRTHPLIKDKSVVIAFWRSTEDGQSANGGRNRLEPAAPGVTHEVAGPLRLCSSRALHGSLRPDQWQGERWWVVALHEPVERDGNKVGSLKRTIIEEWG